MIIRFAAPEDAQLLGDLRIAMRRERETAPPPADEKAFLQANVDYFFQAVADGSYVGVIAEINGEAAGTCGICLHNHPPSYAVPNGKTACLLNMYTVPAFRGRGAAKLMLQTMVDHARKLGCCQVFLNASDMGKSLYEKFGFRSVSNEMVYDL